MPDSEWRFCWCSAADHGEDEAGGDADSVDEARGKESQQEAEENLREDLCLEPLQKVSGLLTSVREKMRRSEPSRVLWMVSQWRPAGGCTPASP